MLREYAGAAAQGALDAEVRPQGTRFARRGDVLDTVTGDLTTQNLIAAERRLIAAVIGRAGEGVAVVGRDVLERALAAVARPLSDEQAEALRGVSTSGNGVDVIEALAGTGKTFHRRRTAARLRGGRLPRRRPRPHRARGTRARRGGRRGGVDARPGAASCGTVTHCPSAPSLLDEAGMGATRGSERLLAAAQDAGAKLIAIGDSGQLPSV